MSKNYKISHFENELVSKRYLENISNKLKKNIVTGQVMTKISRIYSKDGDVDYSKQLSFNKVESRADDEL